LSYDEFGRFIDESDNPNNGIDRQLTEEFIPTCEGSTALLVPKESLRTKVPPRTPAFFNPAARLSRDISILIYTSFIRIYSNQFKNGQITLADAFSGVGARSIRVAKETPCIDKVILNDLNPIAIRAARESARINNVAEKCLYFEKDIHVFLNARNSIKKERYVIVDLDPFGSPSQYADSLLRAVTDGGLVSVTATDTAVLFGKYPKVCFRKYYSKPINCNYSNEIAVRILISFLGLVAGRMDLSIEPVFAHSHRHYSRVYVRVRVSSNEANKLSDNLGYITHCFNCGDRRKHPFTFQLPLLCSICGGNDRNNKNDKKIHIAGPLWIKPIFNKQLISDVLYIEGNSNYGAGSYESNRGVLVPPSKDYHSDIISNKHKHGGYFAKGSLPPPSRLPCSENSIQISSQKTFRHIFQLLHLAILELDDQPYYYTIDEVGSALKTSPPPMNTILERITQGGFCGSRTSFRPTGFKTNASMEEIKKLL
jgi:tRNA (guanine26-N2/guanine27-N2)-dimethyltransferase